MENFSYRIEEATPVYACLLSIYIAIKKILQSCVEQNRSNNIIIHVDCGSALLLIRKNLQHNAHIRIVPIIIDLAHKFHMQTAKKIEIRYWPGGKGHHRAAHRAAKSAVSRSGLDKWEPMRLKKILQKRAWFDWSQAKRLNRYGIAQFILLAQDADTMKKCDCANLLNESGSQLLASQHNTTWEKICKCKTFTKGRREHLGCESMDQQQLVKIVRKFDMRLLAFLEETQRGKHSWKARKGMNLLPLLEDDNTEDLNYDCIEVGADGCFMMNGRPIDGDDGDTGTQGRGNYDAEMI